MRKILILFLFLMFLLHKDAVVLAGMEGLKIWSNTLFPLLFPTFILSDLLLSSGIVNSITKWFGKLFSRIFKCSPYGLYVLCISFLSGTPTNAKNLKVLYDHHSISGNDVTKILSMSLFFNPLLILRLAGWKVLFAIWFSNLFTSVLMRHWLVSETIEFKPLSISFQLSTSIENNIHILFSILGTITIFLVLASIVPLPTIFLKTVFAGILEITNGLNKLNLHYSSYIIKDYLAVLFISFGGISIITQIKSILKDTPISWNYFFISRLITACIGICTLCLIA